MNIAIGVMAVVGIFSLPVLLLWISSKITPKGFSDDALIDVLVSRHPITVVLLGDESNKTVASGGKHDGAISADIGINCRIKMSSEYREIVLGHIDQTIDAHMCRAGVVIPENSGDIGP